MMEKTVDKISRRAANGPYCYWIVSYSYRAVDQCLQYPLLLSYVTISMTFAVQWRGDM